MTDTTPAGWIPDGHDMTETWHAATTLARTLDRLRTDGHRMDGTMTTPDRSTVRLDMTPAMAATLADIIDTADGYRVHPYPDTEDTTDTTRRT